MSKTLCITLCGTAIWLAAIMTGRAQVYSSGTNNITTAVTGSIELDGGVLNIDAGGIVTGSGVGIQVDGGILNVYGNVTGGSGTFADGITILGGTVNLYNGGSITGGEDSGYVEGIIMTSGTLNMYGGSIASGNGTYAIGIDSSGGQINMGGGTISGGTGTYAYGISLVQAGLNLQGGTITSGSGLYNTDLSVNAGGGNRNSTADIFGIHFNEPLGPLTIGSGTLTGTLNNGTALDLTYSQFPASQIILAPEPSTVALAGLGAVALWLRRRSK